SGAGRVLVLNLAAQPGETEGYPPEAHLDMLGLHVPELRVDVVVADPRTVPDVELLASATADLGGRLHLAPVGVPGRPLHDPDRLAVAFQEIFAGSGPPSDDRRSVRSGFQTSRE
nr:hypothetical protein [Micromonospora sp. DSM 115978]